MKIYVAKRDIYGNPYNSGQVFLNNKLIGELVKIGGVKIWANKMLLKY